MSLPSNTVLILHAHNRTNHYFTEVFTTEEHLELFLKAHPEFVKDEITMHELNPS